MDSSTGHLNDAFFYDADDDFDGDSVEFNGNLNQTKHQISIGWRNLRYQSGNCFGPKKVILRRLNGHFRYHTLNALMGPSGAGKTTLLNCLTGNFKSGLTNRSEIYLNKAEKCPLSYFIEQHVHESIVGRLTVGETLRYAYRFKNRGQKADIPMEQYIRNTIEELMLDQSILVRNFTNCSGGEQKRIAVAQELMSLRKPSLLFVDEPTTGLDSNAALVVMSCLKQLTVHYRMTIIAPIHLPNDETLNLFDKLYVMAKGGVCIYSGTPRLLRTYLNDEICLNITKEQQPIEALLKIACNGLDDPYVVKLADLALNDEYHKIETQLSQLECQPFGLTNSRRQFSFVHLFLQLFRLMQILFVSEFRSLLSQMLIYVAYFVTLSSIFDHRMVKPDGCYSLEEQNTTCSNELDSDSLLSENINYLGFCILLIVFMHMCTSAVVFAPLVKVFRNEHRNKWYSMGVFYWSASIVSLLQLTLITSLVCALVYFLPEQHAIDQFAINWHRLSNFVFIIWLVSLYVQSIGQLLGTMFVDQVEIAIIMCQVLCTFMSILNGFYFNTDQSGNQIFIKFSNLIALKFVTKYLLFVFYGIDRCDPEKEFSIVLSENNVDEQFLYHYVVRVLYNTVAIRLLTLLLMYVRFNTFTFNICACKSLRKSKSQLIPIDHNRTCSVNMNQSKHSIERVEDGRNMAEEFFHDKIIIAWRHLTLFVTSSIYEIGSGNNARPILRNLNGQFCFGTLNALMGTSGAGKTTLLKVLNGRYKTRLGEETQFFLSKFTKIETCFITQEVSGHLWTGLTAKQMLIYASRLKNQCHKGQQNLDHEKIALYLLDELNIKDTINTKSENCSGGERKRLALALELTSLQMPNLICIDEPTSGLDSNSSEKVMSCLANLSRKHNLTIIASIHQPNSEVLMMFDQLYVLARGGVCVYSGTPNAISTHLGTVSQIKEYKCTFPIELLVKHSCSGHLDPIVQELASNNDTQFTSEQADLTEQVQLVPDGLFQNRTRFSLESSYVLSVRYLHYIIGYLWQQWLIYIAIYVLYSFLLMFFFEPQIALPSGCVRLDEDFNNTCGHTAEKIEEDNQLRKNFKYNFFMNTIFLFIILLQSSLNFRKEIVYFYNEHRNGWYSSGSFYLMKCLVESIAVVPIICFHVYICNIYESIRPGIYWNLVALLTLSAFGFQGLAHMFSVISNGNITILTMISISIFLFMCLLGNLYVNLSRLHYLYRGLSNLSICRFVFEGALILEYGFHRCGHKQVQIFLHLLSLEDDDLFHCAQMLIFNLILYRLIAIGLLVAKSNPVQDRRQRSERIANFQQQLETTKAIFVGLSSNHRFRIKQFSAEEL